MGRRIGLLGGTFDPPHRGHLALAAAAREQLALDVVLFLPVGDPPHKQDRVVTAVSHRTNMVQLTIADHPHYTLDESDIHRPRPHSTVTLLPLLRQQHPDAAFWLIIGADSLRDFPTWHNPDELVTQCRLAVLSRPSVVLDWAGLQTAVSGLQTAVDFLDPPHFRISSTTIRQRVRAGLAIDGMVETAVSDYITTHHLYV
jgi:nicotinate-nucleotide adenylyltransferase